jgi:CRP-like cAMP-binding protein/Fe-S-cluster-containing hydrogenase component 2
MFSDEQLVPDNYLLHFVASSKLVVLAPGTVLIREGEFSRTLYFILDGYIECSSLDANDIGMPVAILHRGEYIGEIGMMNGQVQNITARTQSPAIVLEVPEQVMQRLMEIVPTVESFFERLSIARSVEAVLQRLPLFQGVLSADIHQLAEHAAIRRYNRDERLFSEDNAGQPSRDSLHILLDGFVKVARRTAQGTGRAKTDERIIAYRQGGDYFAGGLDVLGDRRAVTVTSITRSTIAEISRGMVKDLLMRYPEVKQRFQERLQLYKLATAAAHSTVFEPFGNAVLDPLAVNKFSDVEARAGLHALVDDGVVEGTEVLVIDLDKCIHCDECEEACERRHGHSRLNRKGMVVGNISITTACRQCQDPVCMLCSRAGIARKPSGEVYITESCIGCGICAERCPYDNISIVTLDEQEGSKTPAASLPSWQRFSQFFKQESSKRKPLPMAHSTLSGGPLNKYRPLDAVEEMRKKIAIKCDLCAGYSNQACVQACPTGAAFRINPVAFFGSTEEILRQRAR